LKKYTANLFLSISLFSFLPSSRMALAEENTENPYILIYKFRLASTRADLDQAKVTLKNAENRLNILQDLNRDGAIGELTVKDQEALVATTKLSIVGLEAKAQEADALYQVARIRIAAGLEMPVCPED
jgi:chaperonin GroEL (HSP60 family)